VNAKRAVAAGPSLRTQVLALAVASLFVSVALAIAILVAAPPPKPSPVSLQEVARAFKGGSLETAWGMRLVRTTGRIDDFPQAPPLPPMRGQRAALAAMVGVPTARILLTEERQPALVRFLTRGVGIAGGPPPPPIAGLHPPDWPPAMRPWEDHLFDDFVAALVEPNGKLLIVRPAPAAFPTPWQLGVAVWLAGSAVLLTPTAFWLARRVTAPFDNFARAAQQLGRDPLAPPLIVTGPREVRRAAQAFNDMQMRVRRYVEDRTGMVGAISHDLRTPLARIRFKLEAEPISRRSIVSDLDQMDVMIGQVLTFLREAREPRERERIDLLSLVETAVDEAVNGGAPVALVREDVGIVEGDVSALLRLLGNLIGNAVKYGKRADVSVFAGHGELRVEIEDDGPGLPQAEREAVFRPFYRTEAARTLDVGGVGLGLALSRSIARAHGGELGLEVRERGLVAVLTLPAVPGATLTSV